MNATLRLTQLGFNLIALLDKGKVLDIDQTHTHIGDGSLLTWLKDEFGTGIDLSAYNSSDQAEILDLFGSLSNVADSRRKFGVERNGLALLAAYCLEGLQEMHAR